MKKLVGLAILVLGAAALWIAGEFLIARPRGLEIQRTANPRSPVQLNRTDFWTAIRDLDLSAADATANSDDQRRFVHSLRSVVAGDRTTAVQDFQTLVEYAAEPRLREESREALTRLLRAMSRWDDLAALDPADLDAAAYRNAPAEQYQFPEEPVRLPTNIGWLRIPRFPVELNGRRYEFAIDTGAGATVITSSVAAETGIAPSEQSRRVETSTSIRIEWRTALASELRLGELIIRNHPIGVVNDDDLDFGFTQLDGVIGWPVFEHMRVEIDYARGLTTLSEPELRAGERRNLFWLGYPMVTLHSTEGVPLHFGLDTGARNTTLKPNALNKLDLGPIETSRGMTLGAGGTETKTRRRARNFSLFSGPTRFHFQRITVREGVKNLAILAPDGQLGSDVAYHGKMIVDFANGVFALDVR